MDYFQFCSLERTILILKPELNALSMNALNMLQLLSSNTTKI